MKQRTSHSGRRHGREFKGVVKKITGKLTSDRRLEQEGRDEMLATPRTSHRKLPPKHERAPGRLNPDPHRRG